MVKARNIMIALLIAAAFPIASFAAGRDLPVSQRERYDGHQRFEDREFGNGQRGDGLVDLRHFGFRDIDRLQERQRERILQGIRSGELTRSEANRLLAEQRMIRQEERRYRVDGVLTGAERRELWHDLNAAGRHIYNETRDAQDRR